MTDRIRELERIAVSARFLCDLLERPGKVSGVVIGLAHQELKELLVEAGN